MDSNQQMQGLSEGIVDDSTDSNRPALLFVGANKPAPNICGYHCHCKLVTVLRERDRRIM